MPSTASGPSSDREVWIAEVRGYTALVTSVTCILSILLTGDTELCIPILVLCVIAGGIGYLIAILRTDEYGDKNDPSDSIFG